MPFTIEDARKVRARMEYVATEWNDEDALEYSAFYPFWDPTGTYAVGDRCRYEDKLYKCLQAHTAHEGWNPLVTTSLWAEICQDKMELILANGHSQIAQILI